ncbi:hypothetical protein GCM10009715_39460 [Paeniglutamicibacter psychrophenolicus]|uniref:Pilus assembly protein Flp/PilA n=1 Tax=Paeniglutamicibacter psychrophenolicus TaxID=257454 RepID=A0ABS4WIK4_9MICC|nr:Flp family type IVb pilin [Paeniglutamicibacter psychrophenolicus]MBP2376042.1 pilus assembly protein Flp/PilA [Paeniglutamicibacter psychrophenolicus]
MNTLLANIFLALQTVGDKLRREEKGATAVEYGIMVAGIAVAVIAVVFLLGSTLDGMFEGVEACVAAPGTVCVP